MIILWFSAAYIKEEFCNAKNFYQINLWKFQAVSRNYWYRFTEGFRQILISVIRICSQSDRKIVLCTLCGRVRCRSDSRYNALSSASKLFPGGFLGDQRVRLIATSAWFIAGIMQRQASEWIHIVAQHVPNVSGSVSACASHFSRCATRFFRSTIRLINAYTLHLYRKNKIFLRMTFTPVNMRAKRLSLQAISFIKLFY